MKTMELRFKKLNLKKNAFLSNEKGNNVIELTLYYPTPGRATVKTIRQIPYTVGTDVEGDKGYKVFNEKIINSWKLLFREQINLPTFLHIQVSAIIKVSEIEKMIMGSVFGGAKEAIGTFNSYTGVTGFVTNFMGSFISKLAPKDKEYMIAEGIIEIDPEKNYKNPITIDLFVPRMIEDGRSVTHKKPISWDQNGKINGWERVTFSEGEANGSIEFELFIQ